MKNIPASASLSSLTLEAPDALLPPLGSHLRETLGAIEVGLLAIGSIHCKRDMRESQMPLLNPLKNAKRAREDADIPLQR